MSKCLGYDISVRQHSKSEHRRDMTERLLKATLSPNQTKPEIKIACVCVVRMGMWGGGRRQVRHQLHPRSIYILKRYNWYTVWYGSHKMSYSTRSYCSLYCFSSVRSMSTCREFENCFLLFHYENLMLSV